jgi:hypothetical protein
METLIECFECGRKISSELRKCPHCGKNSRGRLCKLCNKVTKDIDFIIFVSIGVHLHCLEQLKNEIFSHYSDQHCSLCGQTLYKAGSYVSWKLSETHESFAKECDRTPDAWAKDYSLTCPECGHKNSYLPCYFCKKPIFGDPHFIKVGYFDWELGDVLNKKYSVISKETSDWYNNEEYSYFSCKRYYSRDIPFHSNCKKLEMELFPNNYYDENIKRNSDREFEIEKMKYIHEHSDKKCFIATATFGDNSIEVDTLRNIRDRHLRFTKFGNMFLKIYEYFSPPLARIIAKNKFLRSISKYFIVKPAIIILKTIMSLNNTRQ